MSKAVHFKDARGLPFCNQKGFSSILTQHSHELTCKRCIHDLNLLNDREHARRIVNLEPGCVGQFNEEELKGGFSLLW